MPEIDDNDDCSGRINDPWSRAGNLWDEKIINGKIWCGSSGKHDTFDRNVVLPNGDTYLCCMDYGLKHKIGNLFETDFYSLDRSQIIRMANEESSDLICRKCTICKKQ